MATRRSKLETVFTGDDRPFQKVAARVEAAGKRAAGVGRAMGAAFATIGGSFAIKQTIDKFDRIGKIATRLDTTAESVQRLAFVAEQSGSSLQQLQAILTRLERRTGEALRDPSGTQAKRFQELNINVDRFASLDPEGKLKRMADAFTELGNSEATVASLMGLLDTEVRELIPMLSLGGAGIESLGRSISTVSHENVRQLEALNDKLNKISTEGVVKFAQGLSKIAQVIDEIQKGVKIIGEFAGAFADAVQRGELEVGREAEFWDTMRDAADRARESTEKATDAVIEARTKPGIFEFGAHQRVRNTDFFRQGVGSTPRSGRGGGSPLDYLRGPSSPQEKSVKRLQKIEMSNEAMLRVAQLTYSLFQANLAR